MQYSACESPPETSTLLHKSKNLQEEPLFCHGKISQSPFHEAVTTRGAGGCARNRSSEGRQNTLARASRTAGCPLSNARPVGTHGRARFFSVGVGPASLAARAAYAAWPISWASSSRPLKRTGLPSGSWAGSTSPSHTSPSRSNFSERTTHWNAGRTWSANSTILVG